MLWNIAEAANKQCFEKIAILQDSYSLQPSDTNSSACISKELSLYFAYSYFTEQL